MKLKLERDQARAIRQDFFPYLESLCEMHYQDTRQDTNMNLTVLVIRSLFIDLVKHFDQKLLTTANNFTFKLSDAHGITLYLLLMQLPLRLDQYWLVNLRQLVVDTLHHQMSEPG